MARTRAETATALAHLCAASVYPQLSSDDLLRIVDSCRRASTHALDTAYAVGDVVIPATPNGRAYRCIAAGTSDDTTAPEFPTSTLYHVIGYRFAEATGDVVWQDIGPIAQETYDLRWAASKAWTEKAGRVSADIDASDDNKSVKLSQLHAHCLTMAARYRPLEVW